VCLHSTPREQPRGRQFGPIAMTTSLNSSALNSDSTTQELERERARLQLLLEVNNAIISKLELPELFAAITTALRRILRHEFSQLYLYDPEIQQLHTRALCFPNGKGLVYEGMIVPIEGTPAGWVYTNGKPMRMDRPDAVRTPNDIVDRLLEEGVISGCCVPLVCHDHVLGVLSVGSSREAAFSLGDEELLCTVAGQFAIAIENALTHDSLRRSQVELAEGNSRLRLLLELNNVFVTKLEIRELFPAISSSLRRLTRHDYSQIVLQDAAAGGLVVRALDFPEGKGLIHEQLIVPTQGTPAGRVFVEGKPLIIEHLEYEAFPSEVTKRLLKEGVQSICLVPLTSHQRKLGVLSLGRSQQNDPFTQSEADLLTSVAAQISIAIENALAMEQIAALNERLLKENYYLEEALRTEAGFEDIIGESSAIRSVLSRVELAAPTDANILILGETGTGKELIARAIHNLSSRHDRPFIKLNCAAIPAGLVESELFGHEKGAYTGAIAQRVGHVELADGGTLFLDEIGDLPLELQPKLLRVLQEKAFERLGGTRTIRVNIRLVAATNRDLPQLVAQHQFRDDLYYRLSVFPILVPPLRQRAEDIAMLVHYFVQKHSRSMDKKITRIPVAAMEALQSYGWPGNIRELENFIERAVILSRGDVLQAPIGELSPAVNGKFSSIATLEAVEREHIVRTLQLSGWVVGGPAGAAAKLGLKRTTMRAKMRRLGIERDLAAK
jgi:formate hydrogenlyase transcriptional activator